MSDYLLSIILGIVEGLTEFLPVSSTAHLRIVEAILGVDLASGYWKMFSIVIQLGAILVLPIYFRKRIAGFFELRPFDANHPVVLTAVAFVCTAGPAFVLTKIIVAKTVPLYWSPLSFNDSIFRNKSPTCCAFFSI